MLYHAYQAYADASEPVRAMARAGIAMGKIFGGFSPANSGLAGFTQSLSALLELTARSKMIHTRPPYAIDKVKVGGEEVPVREEIVLSLPFCDLIRFAKDGVPAQPKMLVVAPLSGHFATLLRNTVETLSRDHDE